MIIATFFITNRLIMARTNVSREIRKVIERKGAILDP